MAGCTSNEAPVTDEGLWKDARPTGASLPYPRDTPTIIARHRTAGTSQQDDLGTAVAVDHVMSGELVAVRHEGRRAELTLKWDFSAPFVLTLDNGYTALLRPFPERPGPL